MWVWARWITRHLSMIDFNAISIRLWRKKNGVVSGFAVVFISNKAIGRMRSIFFSKYYPEKKVTKWSFCFQTLLPHHSNVSFQNCRAWVSGCVMDARQPPKQLTWVSCHRPCFMSFSLVLNGKSLLHERL